MAKSKSFFGLRRGSTKSLTFQVLDGQQITKDRVTEVRNPRTEKQQIQRVIMLTALNAYSKMMTICDHSFEGVSYGGKTQQAFMSENLRAVRNRIASSHMQYGNQKAFVPVGQSFLAPNYYVMSKGSLPPVEYRFANGFNVKAGATYADVIAQLKATPGDQLTICLIVGNDNVEQNRFRFCRVILQPQDEVGNNLPFSSAFVGEDGQIANPNKKNEETEAFTFSQPVDGWMNVGYGTERVLAGCAILSSFVNNKWLRSTQAMAVVSSHPGYTLNEAIKSSIAEIEVDDNYYLNNAGDNENPVLAEVSAMTYGATVIADGLELSGRNTLSIEGTNLSTANVKVFMNEEQWVPATLTSQKITFDVASNGTLRIEVNGVTRSTNVVSGITQPTLISKVLVGSKTVYNNGQDGNAKIGQLPFEAKVNPGDSFTVEVRSFDGLITNQAFTHSNTGWQSNAYMQNQPTVARIAYSPNSGGSSTISFGGQVIGAISVDEDGSLDS